LLDDKYLERMEKVSLAVYKKLVQKLTKGIGLQLSMPQIQLLMFVRNGDPCIISDIAGHFDVTLGAVTGLVDKLESMGLVIRQRSGADRRVVEILLTGKGEKVLEDIKANVIKLYKDSLSGFAEEDVRTYFKVTDRIVECILAD